MAVRGIGTDEIPPCGGFPTRLQAYTLATYSAAGTAAPAVGDYVSPTTTNDRVVLTPDNTAGSADLIGRVKQVDTTNLQVVVEWLNCLGFVELPCDDATTATLNNAAIKDGDTTVVANFDAGATTGPFKVISKSGTSGAITLCCGVMVG